MKNAQKSPIYVIPQEVGMTSDTLKNAGFEAFLVGGCVRDMLLGTTPKDWDITTNATPEKIEKLFEHTFYENTFGTVGVVHDETTDPTLKTIEVTTYRLESGYSDSRHPDEVRFSSNLEDDLERRDFTVNALALSIPVGAQNIHTLSPEPTDDSDNGHLVDLFGGSKDLATGTIRAVGEPEERFSEDALRILRAVRFAAELGFTIAPETEKAITKLGHTLKNIAQERIRDEFIKILMSPNPQNGLLLSHKMNVLPYMLPELEEGIDIDQNQAHSYTVFEHLLRALQATADKKWPLELRLAALLHDIGKPATRRWEKKKNDWSFHGHEVVGARMTRKALKRLRFPREITDTVTKLVRWHMFFSDTDVVTHSAVRRLMRNVGPENVESLMNLRIADRVGTGRPKEEPYRFRKYKAMIEEVRRDPISVGMLKINGDQIMEFSGEPPSKKIGWTLHALLNDVLEDPSLNTYENLKNRAQELLQLPSEELEALGKKGADTKEKAEASEIKKIRDDHWVQ